jgi:hypothetical protein
VFVQQVHVSLTMAAIMLVTGFVFSAVAGYMAGLVGSSNNPISGVTIATVLVSSLLLVVLMGSDAKNGPAAAIIIGSVVCCAAAIAGDNMQDLKAGYIVKATPWKQQVMQLVGTVSAALVLAPVMMLLQEAYGFAGQAGAGPKALPAPQANLMASVAKGVFEGGLPWNYVYLGMVVAAGVIALDLYLQKKGCSFRTPVLAVAIGDTPGPQELQQKAKQPYRRGRGLESKRAAVCFGTDYGRGADGYPDGDTNCDSGQKGYISAAVGNADGLACGYRFACGCSILAVSHRAGKNAISEKPKHTRGDAGLQR